MFLVYIAGRLHQRRSHTDISIEELRPMRLSPYRVAVTSACLLLAAAFTGCGQPASTPAPAAPPTAAPAESQIDRGHRLVIGGGCHDCHTPKKIGPNGPEADMTRMLSGHPESDKVTEPYKQKAGEKWTIHINDHLTAWSGAWGVSFAANLTPDMNTGLGIWTEDMFVQALKQGKHMGKSRPILPPMPWNWYGQLPDDDLKAMFAYLKSIPAVSNRVPVPLGPDGKPIEAP
jgi:mono/diheme cytochrome c family protein